MHKTMKRTSGSLSNSITVSAETLAGMLDCGIGSAKKIGSDAGAKIKIGSRVLYRTDKIREHLETITQ